MATGALIGGAVIGGIGKIKGGKSQKKAAKKQYKAIEESVERSREVEKTRTAAEKIADDALKKSNEAFKDFNDKQYGNYQETSQDWASANAERLNLEMQNIALGAEERAEQVKRQERTNEIYEGRAGTRRSASGFGGGSSLDAWVNTIEATNESDVAWMVSAGESRDNLATQDANLRFEMGENERAAADRTALLGHESGAAKYDMYESEREANSVMREADRAQREADRQYALDSGDATRMAGIGQGNANIIGGIGGALSGASGIANSYDKFGWGWS